MPAPPTATFEELPAEVAPAPPRRAPATTRPQRRSTPFAATSAPAPASTRAPGSTRAVTTARASKPETVPREGLGYVSALFGVGPGLGSVGPGGSYFVTVDVWPWRYFGLGVEGMRAATVELALFGGAQKRSFDAVRGRLSLRLPLKNARPWPRAAVSFALGPAAVGGEHPGDRESTDEDCFGCSPRQVTRPTSTEVSTGLALAGLGRVGVFEFGGALRADFAGDADIVTVSLLVGFEL